MTKIILESISKPAGGEVFKQTFEFEGVVVMDGQDFRLDYWDETIASNTAVEFHGGNGYIENKNSLFKLEKNNLTETKIVTPQGNFNMIISFISQSIVGREIRIKYEILAPNKDKLVNLFLKYKV